MPGTVDPVESPTTPGPRLNKTEARQGQNIRGMLTVLVVSTLLVGGVFAVMLTMGQKPAAKEAAPVAQIEQPAPQPAPP